MAALANEKGRQQSELRERCLAMRAASPSRGMIVDANSNEPHRRAAHKDDRTVPDDQTNSPSESKQERVVKESLLYPPNLPGQDAPSREMLEAAARASLRTKFDHVGIDPHSSPDRDMRSISENRGLTNSPPPPSLALSAAPSNIALQGHAGVTGFVRQHISDHGSDHALGRVPSPILFSPGADPAIHTHSNTHMLQLHHAAALAGVTLGRAHPSSPELMTIDAALGTRSQISVGTETADFEVSVLIG